MSLCVNHGGVAVVAATGIRVSAVDLGVQPMTFECIAARITSFTSRCLAVVIYRPGSADVTASFVTELADVLDRVLTFADPLVHAGDLNLRLERQHDPHTPWSSTTDGLRSASTSRRCDARRQQSIGHRVYA